MSAWVAGCSYIYALFELAPLTHPYTVLYALHIVAFPASCQVSVITLKKLLLRKDVCYCVGDDSNDKAGDESLRKTTMK